MKKLILTLNYVTYILESRPLDNEKFYFYSVLWPYKGDHERLELAYSDHDHAIEHVQHRANGGAWTHKIVKLEYITLPTKELPRQTIQLV